MEAQRYLELRERQSKGDIFGLICQPQYQLTVNGIAICKYIADFRYFTDEANAHASLVVEDVKGGIITNDFTMKKKLMLALHGISVVIVTKKSRNKTSRWFWNGVMEERMWLKEIDNDPR